MTVEPLGRRERKKAATRASIVEAALTLFFERGFEQVSVREIADLADVSPKTVFSHFPRKEALVFSDEGERHDGLVRAVTSRSSDTSISNALIAHYIAELEAMQTGPQQRVMALMEATPSLVDYAERMWLRHEGALAEAITEQLGLSEMTDEIRFYAQFALQIQLHASRSEDPAATIRAGFRLLDRGWDQYQSDLG
jgi:AcrR family transcriptional regulator